MNIRPDGKGAKSKLSPAAARALEEAGQRRKSRRRENTQSEKEIGGRGGLDPVRHGDWEKDGIVSDF